MTYKIADIVTLLNGEYKGEILEEVSKLSPFFYSDEKSITFAGDEKFLKSLDKTKAKVIIVPDIDLPLNIGKSYIVVKDNPRTIMPKLLHFFQRPIKKVEKMIEDSSKIGENTNIATNVYIGHDVEIGKNCIIQPGAVIGSDGFGYVKVNGKNTKIDQIGTVIIEDEVEIGANTTIDRGAIGDTIIKKYTKIDNLVQIAHNDIIGENCLIISQVGIAGSTTIGNNVTLAGQVGIAGHIEIGDNTMIGAKSGVHGNVEGNQILSGHPLVDHREDLKIRIAMKKLPELLKRVKALESK